MQINKSIIMTFLVKGGMMKVLLIVLLACISVFADQIRIEKNQKGDVRIVNTQDTWTLMTPIEYKAYNNPGVKFYIFETKYNKVDFWHYREIKIAKKYIYFDKQLQRIIEKETNLIKSNEVKFARHIAVSLMILILFVALNFVMYTNKIKSYIMFYIVIILTVTAGSAVVFFRNYITAISWFAAITTAYFISDRYKITVMQKWFIVDYLLIGSYLIFWAI